MVAGMAHDRLEPAAEFEVRAFLRARLLFRAGLRGLRGHHGEMARRQRRNE
jgi:hypothetical protein